MNHEAIAEFTSICTTSNPAKTLSALRAKAQAFQAAKEFATRRTKKISNPFTIPGKGVGVQITVRVYLAK